MLVKSKMKISSNLVAFSKNTNFNKKNDLLFFMMTTTIGFQAINTTQDEQRYKEKAHKSDYDPLV